MKYVTRTYSADDGSGSGMTAEQQAAQDTARQNAEKAAAALQSSSDASTAKTATKPEATTVSGFRSTKPGAKAKKQAKPERVPVRNRPGGAPHNSETASRPQPIDESQRLRKAFKRRASKVLYFINGATPSVEDFEAAQRIGPGVVFRNALKIVDGAPLENCDGVAGEIPRDYAEVFPEAASDFAVTDGEMPSGIVSRPERSHLQASGNNPDDVRPGTVDTGLAHLSGTGSEKSGGLDPSSLPGYAAPDGTVNAPRSNAAVWKSNKASP